jgi:hypothetical protein
MAEVMDPELRQAILGLAEDMKGIRKNTHRIAEAMEGLREAVTEDVAGALERVACAAELSSLCTWLDSREAETRDDEQTKAAQAEVMDLVDVVIGTVGDDDDDDEELDDDDDDEPE